MAGALWAYYDNCYDDDDTESAQPDDLINADVFASVEAWESILPGQSSRERMLTMENSLSRNRAKLQESILLESRKSHGRQLQQAMLYSRHEHEQRQLDSRIQGKWRSNRAHAYIAAASFRAEHGSSLSSNGHAVETRKIGIGRHRAVGASSMCGFLSEMDKLEDGFVSRQGYTNGTDGIIRLSRGYRKYVTSVRGRLLEHLDSNRHYYRPGKGVGNEPPTDVATGERGIVDRQGGETDYARRPATKADGHGGGADKARRPATKADGHGGGADKARRPEAAIKSRPSSTGRGLDIDEMNVEVNADKSDCSNRNGQQRPSPPSPTSRKLQQQQMRSTRWWHLHAPGGVGAKRQTTQSRRHRPMSGVESDPYPDILVRTLDGDEGLAGGPGALPMVRPARGRKAAQTYRPLRDTGSGEMRKLDGDRRLPILSDWPDNAGYTGPSAPTTARPQDMLEMCGLLSQSGCRWMRVRRAGSVRAQPKTSTSASAGSPSPGTGSAPVTTTMEASLPLPALAARGKLRFDAALADRTQCAEVRDDLPVGAPTSTRGRALSSSPGTARSINPFMEGLLDKYGKQRRGGQLRAMTTIRRGLRLSQTSPRGPGISFSRGWRQRRKQHQRPQWSSVTAEQAKSWSVKQRRQELARGRASGEIVSTTGAAKPRSSSKVTRRYGDVPA